MLTFLTQQALAVLHDIAGRQCVRQNTYSLDTDELSSLLDKLDKGNLIYLCEGEPAHTPGSYRLMRPLGRISLLDVIEATGEHLNCNRPTSEEFYFRYGAVAQKLGVVNQMTRSFLADIKLTDC